MTYDHSWAEDASHCAFMRFYRAPPKPPVVVVDGKLTLDPDPDIQERFRNMTAIQTMATRWLMRVNP